MARANRPIRASSRTVPLLDQSLPEENNRSDFIVDFVNASVEFADQVNAYRETSPSVIDNSQDVSRLNLQPNSVVSVNDNASGLETPPELAPFFDGGYESHETLSKTTADELKFKYAVSTDPVLSNTDGFRWYGSSNTDRHEFNFPSFPSRLPCRIRSISTGGEISFNTFSSDVVSTYRGRARGVFLTDDNETFFRTYLPRFAENLYGEYQDIRNIENLNLDTSIIVQETLFTPTSADVSFATGTITTTIGYFDTIQEAYAETKPGRAFACLRADHPNYIGTTTIEGRYDLDFDVNTGFTTPVLNFNKLFYTEVRAGGVKNNLLHNIAMLRVDPRAGELPNPEELTEQEIN